MGDIFLKSPTKEVLVSIEKYRRDKYSLGELFLILKGTCFIDKTFSESRYD